MPKTTTQLGDLANPIEATLDGDMLTLRINLAYRSSTVTAKGNVRIASTLGNKEVLPFVFIGVNAYAKAGA